MRPQQRKFIVEVKSARRRSAVRPASIWGDTDLKALAREAESEAAHLFDVVSRADHVRGQEECVANIAPSIVAHIPDQSDDPFACAEEASALPVAAISPPVTALQVLNVPRQIRGRRARSTKADVPLKIPADDLAMLEQENRELKRLLVQRLQKENAQLRRMLARFI